MNLRCRPGDTAVIVTSDFEEHIGRLCLVLKESWVDSDGDYCWLVRCPSPLQWEEAETGRFVFSRSGHYPDHWLRPLRDPGEDATDEMLQLLGKPAITEMLKAAKEAV